jgi:ABC-type transporter lipoprotein component MlaA
MATNILIYKSPVNYRSDASLRAKIAEIDILIDELINTAMKSVTQGNIAEYELDTGQTRTRIKYTSVGSVAQSIEDYEKIRQMYLNKLNRTTGSVRLMGEQNFKNRFRG